MCKKRFVDNKTIAATASTMADDLARLEEMATEARTRLDDAIRQLESGLIRLAEMVGAAAAEATATARLENTLHQLQNDLARMRANNSTRLIE